MAEALEVLALQNAFRGNVCLHRDLQAAEFLQGTQFHHLWFPLYQHNKVQC
jgi:hypothetical protein